MSRADSASTPSKTAPWDYDRPQLDFEHAWRGYPREWRSFVHAARARGRGTISAPTERFVIFGRGRSGSTLLVSLLNSHSRISCLGELLRSRMLFPEAHRDRMLGMASDKTHRGFKLLTYQITQVMRHRADSGYLRRMADDGFRVIYVHRDNYLRLAVSNMYARMVGRFHSRGAAGGKTDERLEFPPGELIDWMSGAERRTDDEMRLLEQVPHVDVEYATDLEPPDARAATVERICAMLGVEPEPLETDLKRNTPRSLRDLIANYDEVHDAIEATRFARFLDGADRAESRSTE